MTSTRRPPSCAFKVLLPVAGAAARARNVITEACLQWQLPNLLAPASLIVTELVTNGVRHAHTLMDLHVVHGRWYLLIALRDGSTSLPTMPPPSMINAHRDHPDLSRGLPFIDAIADRWGCWPTPGGKIVWAALQHAVAVPKAIAPTTL